MRVFSVLLRLFPVALLLALALPAAADFQLIDDFESYVPGPIDEQNGWVAHSENSAVADDPADLGNQVLSVITESTNLHRDLLLLDDTRRMFFLRFRFEDQLNFSLGISDSVYPTQFGDFEVELGLANATPELRVNDDGVYRTICELEPETWYQCWLLIDNVNETFQVWLHDRPGDAACEEDRLEIEDQDTFGFRSYRAYDLDSFFIKTGGGNGVAGPLYLDDLYMETGPWANLGHPLTTTAAPAALPAAARLSAPVPNPFNPTTTLAYSLAEAGQVELSIHDASGRLVRRFPARLREAGEYAERWNGRDDAGRAQPSGLYLVRLAVDGRTVQMRKAALLK